MNKKKVILLIVLIAGIAALLIPSAFNLFTPRAAFDGNRAMKDVEYQVSLGPRLPGSSAHQQTVQWIQEQLLQAGWQTEIQETSLMNQPIRNVIAKRGSGQPWILIGAHFDSRQWADKDPDPSRHKDPVPGANDGASGVAVLLELARVLPVTGDKQIWLVFFDSEDQGSIPGWDWILGSQALADSLTTHPDAVVIIDMIGDANLNIYREKNSDRRLTDELWRSAEALGYGGQFINKEKYRILDDHLPFARKGIPAVDIIDFDYPQWHTTADTVDKVSPVSLKAVGDTLIHWIDNTAILNPSLDKK